MRRKHLLSLFMLSMGVALLVAATAVGVASSATHATQAATKKPKKGGTLQINQSAGTFDTLDPGLSYVTNDWGLEWNVSLLLVNYPDKSGKAGSTLFPEAAKAFPTISKNGKVYTFHLRPGQRFNDGSPVTAKSYARAWERILSPKMYAQYGLADQLQLDVVGANAFSQGHAQHISGIKAKGLNLTFHLTHPIPFFTSILAMQWFAAVKPNLKYTNSKSGLLTYASAGPYYIAANNLNGLTVLKKNKFYHGSRPANASEIVIHNNTDPDSSMLEIQKGQADFDMSGVPSTDVSTFKAKYTKDGQYRKGTTTCIDWIAFNVSRPPTNNLAVRRALNYALGRQPLINILGPDAGAASDSILVPGLQGFTKKFKVYPANPNPAKAKQVGGAALKNGTFDLYYNALSPTRTAQANLIKNEVEQTGAKVNLDGESTGDYYGPLETKGTHYNIARAGWCADYFDPFDYINVNFDGRSIQATGNVDYFYINSAKLNSLMDKAAGTSGKARSTAYANLNKTIMTQYVPLAPYVDDNSRFLLSKRLHNYIYNTYYGYPAFNALTVG
jgi:peptide/nickel transport system substrate-binding protein